MLLVPMLFACVSADPKDEVTGTASPPDWDVVIVGAGAAGLVAASEALSLGARVLVLEREEAPAQGIPESPALLFAGSSEQLAAGIPDGPDVLLAEWASFTGGDARDPWVQALAREGVPRVHDWLVARGLRFEEVPKWDASSGSLPRVHGVSATGASLADVLVDAVPVDVIRTATEAVALLQDEHGRVTGIEFRDRATGAVSLTSAHAVLVATGGFLHDLERVVAERPDLPEDELLVGSWVGADGNGLRMLEDVGAATENLGAMGLYAHGVPAPGTAREELVAHFLGGMPWLNADGARFADESMPNSFALGNTRATQPRGDVWALIDANTAAQMVFEDIGQGFVSLDTMLAEGIVARADSLEALAEEIALPAEQLVQTVGAYNAFARGDVSDAWRHEPRGAMPVLTAPFVAMPVGVTVAKGFGGVDVDLDGAVLDGDGARIAGLYAAGELTGMAGGTLVGDRGFTGSLTAVLLGGRAAGAAAAREALAAR